MIVGCKLLRKDFSSINDEYGRVSYRSTDWITVPGNGAYVAVTEGLTSGGFGPRLAYFECKGPTGVLAPSGVRCFRHVRLIPACPERISPKLRGCIALDVPGLSAKQRVALA